MVFYFISNVVAPPFSIFMGAEKHESKLLNFEVMYLLFKKYSLRTYLIELICIYIFICINSITYLYNFF